MYKKPKNWVMKPNKSNKLMRPKLLRITVQFLR